MAITTASMKLLASARMTDASDGGGQMTGTGLQDAADNNVFPDLSSTDAAFGRLSMRKVWPAVLSADTDTLLGANTITAANPTDADVGVFSFLSSSADEDRAAAVARLQVSHWEALGPAGLTWATAPYARARVKSAGGTVPVVAGMVVYTLQTDGQYLYPVLLLTVTEIPDSDGTFATGFASTTAGDRVFAVTYDGEVSAGEVGARLGVPSTVTPRLSITRPVTGTLDIGDTYCDVDTLLAHVVPKHLGSPAGTAVQIGIDAEPVLPAGVAVGVRRADGLVLHHTAEVAAATYANGNTVATRAGLASVRLVGANNAGILTGWSVNLSTGLVTISDISGWSQPVAVRHTIEEVVACARTGYPEVTGGATAAGTSEATAPFVLSAGLTMFCGRANVGSLRVISKTGQDITDIQHAGVSPGRSFNISLAAGTAALTSDTSVTPAIITSHSPVTLVSSGTYSGVGASSAAQATPNRVTFNRALTKAFPSGTLISSMLFLGDLQARAGLAFSQLSWTSIWADSRIGDPIAAQYQQAGHPIVVTNQGAISERWAIIFLTATTFRLVGQTLGQIATGDVNTLFAPINPATGVPYVSIAAEGWGVWSAGNVLRLNTYGANAPTWQCRSALPGAPAGTPDATLIAFRGDINT